MKKIAIILFLIGIGFSTISLYSQDRTYLSNRIMVEGVLKRNLGNFSDIWSTATGGYISYGIAFPEHNLLIIRSGVIVNNLKDGVDYKVASSTVIPLHIGGRYYFTDDRFMPFFTFMNGLKKAEIDVNRKVLADFAVADPAAFKVFAEKAAAALQK